MAAYLMSEGLARFVSDLRRNSQRGYRGGVDASRQLRLSAPQPNEFPNPYTVVWSESVGSWLVWLPAGALYVGGEEISVTDGLDEAGGDYPSGWYRLPIPSDAETAYLVLTRSDGEVAAEFRDQPADASEESARSYLVAEMSGRSVVQSVASTITGGGGVETLNELVDDVWVEGSDEGIDIEGTTYYVVAEADDADNTIYLSLSTSPQGDPGDDGGDAWCNNISGEGGGGGPGNPDAGGNDISYGPDDGGDNSISGDPCKKGNS